MVYTSRYDPNRKADLKKQSARGKSIARRGKQIRDWRHSQESAYKPFGESSFHPRFERETIDVDVPTQKEIPDRGRRGLLGDMSTMGKDVKDIVSEMPVVNELIRTGKNIFKPLFAHGADFLGGALAGNTRALQNEDILDDAYSDEVRKEMMSPSDREFYEKYMRLASFASGDKAEKYRKIARTALENAQITNRVNYALGQDPFDYDTSASAGQAAFGEDRPVVDYGGLSERLQSGLEGTKGGRDFLSDVIPKGEALRDTGMIGNAAANIAAAQAEGRAGFFEPWMNEEFVSASPEGVSIEDIQIQPKPLSPGDEEERAFQESLMNDPYVQENFDPETGTWRAPTPITHVPPNPTIDERAGTGYTDYRGVNPFTEPYVPMEGPSPVPLPPYLSENTDWFTPEPEAKGLIPRGLEELMIDQYGVDAPGVERESEWPNTPPPGYQPPPPWYSKAWDWMKEGPWPTY
jgi:hypothetical protein